MSVFDKTGQVHNPLRGMADVFDLQSAATLEPYQSGAIISLDNATGFTVTLPVAQFGMRFTFVIYTAVTIGTVKIITADTSTFLYGSISIPVAAGTQTVFFADGSTHRSINLNGTTTGGLVGGRFVLEAFDTVSWMVSGVVKGSGTVATPFATS